MWWFLCVFNLPATVFLPNITLHSFATFSFSVFCILNLTCHSVPCLQCVLWVSAYCAPPPPIISPNPGNNPHTLSVQHPGEVHDVLCTYVDCFNVWRTLVTPMFTLCSRETAKTRFPFASAAFLLDFRSPWRILSWFPFSVERNKQRMNDSEWLCFGNYQQNEIWMKGRRKYPLEYPLDSVVD